VLGASSTNHSVPLTWDTWTLRCCPPHTRLYLCTDCVGFSFQTWLVFSVNPSHFVATRGHRTIKIHGRRDAQIHFSCWCSLALPVACSGLGIGVIFMATSTACFMVRACFRSPHTLHFISRGRLGRTQHRRPACFFFLSFLSRTHLEWLCPPILRPPSPVCRC
jgi:hypothetical protein